MKKLKPVLIALTAAVLAAVLFAVITAVNEKPQDEALYVSLAGLFGFDGDENDLLTRADALHMLLCVINEDNAALDADSPSFFSDVSGTSKKEADYAFANGIAVGDGEALFFPDRGITLEEMLSMVLRVLGSAPADGAEALELADSLRIYPQCDINLMRFEITRGQCAEILWNLLNSAKPGAGSATYADALVSAGKYASSDFDEIRTSVQYDFDAQHTVLTDKIFETTTADTGEKESTGKDTTDDESGWSPIWRP